MDSQAVDFAYPKPAHSTSSSSPATEHGRASGLARAWLVVDRLTLALALGMPAVLTVYLSFNNGGYFPLPPAVGAAGLAIVLALRMALARRLGRRPAAGLLVLVAATAGLAGWTLLSGSWSHAHGRALIAYDRTLMYGLAAAVAGSVAYTGSRLRTAVYLVLGGMVAVCAAAFLSGTLPHLWPTTRALYSSRLSYPLNYPNALGILAAVATLLAVHVTCCAGGSRAARIAAAAATPLTAVTLYMTLSRGAAWSAVLALAVYLAAGRPRELVDGLLAVIPATALAVGATYLIGFRTTPPLGNVIPGGHGIAAIVAAAIVLAAVLRLMGLAGRFRALHVPLPRVDGRRRVALVGLLAALLIAGTAAYVDRLAHDPVSQTRSASVGHGAGRLTSVNPDGRLAFWKVAVKDLRRQPLHGIGAGMYSVTWAASTDGDTTHHDAQSLYLQTLAELGLVGLALLLIALAAIAAGLIRRSRVSERPLFLAILAAGLAWAASAAVDWDWEMPAVTLWLFALGGLALAAPVARRVRRPRPLPRAVRRPLRVAGALACLGLAITPAAMALAQHRQDQSIRALSTSCPRASQYARSALAIIGSRPEPYQILGFCDLGAGHPSGALREMRAGLARDPRNWQLHYGAAIATAATGQSPRAEIVTTDTLAPTDRLVIREALALLSHHQTSDGWRRLAAEAWLPLPLIPLAPNNGPQFQEGTFLNPGTYQSPPPG